VSSGAKWIGTQVDAGALDVVLSGAADTGTVLSSGGYFNQTVQPYGGAEFVSSGGSAVSATVDRGGWLNIFSGGSAIDATVASGGATYVSSGAKWIGTQVDAGALDVVLSGAADTGTVLSSGGDERYGPNAPAAEFVSAGGSAVSVTVNPDAWLNILSGGSAIDTIVASAATTTVGPGGTWIGTQVESGATQYVWSGGADTGTSIASSGTESVSSGGSAVSVTLDGGWLQVQSGGMVAGGIDFAVGSSVVQLGGTALPTVPISGFGAGDRIELTNIAFDPQAPTPTYDSGTGDLHFTENGSAYALHIEATSNYAGDNFTLSNQSGTTITVTCFAPGTRIATPTGEVAVEDLRPGDPVLTASGHARPVRWLGKQTVATRFADPLTAWPIRIRAGALGANRPSRDLLLSPGHALLLGGVLVQAGALVNGSTIARAVRVPERLRYFHVELDSHDLLLAEGVPAESFWEGAETMPFDNEADRPAPAASAPLPYPRVQSARQVPAAIRARVAPWVLAA
jgi:autotransporter passenger strand-loop-strand repeat protein